MKKKFLWKLLLSVVILFVILVVINFIPTWNLKTNGMNMLEGDFVDVYYETAEAAAKDVFELANSQAENIVTRLGFTEKQDVKIYIYDNQLTMQSKKYGYIAPWLGLKWYIGDNIGTDVILTSPANPGKEHNYDSVRNAVLHEMVHGYVSTINSDISLWLTEGMALYLSNGEPFYKKYLQSIDIPSYKDIQTRSPIKFSNIGGYSLAHTYIEYLEKTYGWNRVLELIKSENYMEIFEKSEKDIYSEWVEYLQNYYQ